ncbi:hypothetical protein [Nonomuraea fuscirosea]
MAPALGTAATLIPAGSCDLFPSASSSASGRTKASTTTSRSTAFATTATT